MHVVVFGWAGKNSVGVYSSRLIAGEDHVQGFYEINKEICKMSNKIRPGEDNLCGVNSPEDVAVDRFCVYYAGGVR